MRVDDRVVRDRTVDVSLGEDARRGCVDLGHVLAKVAFPSGGGPPELVLDDAVGEAGGAQVEAGGDSERMGSKFFNISDEGVVRWVGAQD